MPVVVLPAPHTVHAASDEAAEFPAEMAYLPTGQELHVDASAAPIAAENLPAAHAVHVAPLAP